DVSELFKVSMDSLNNEVGLREDYYQPQSYQMPSVPQFTHLNKQEKAERALLKHFMNDKDIFLNYHKLLQPEYFTNKYFIRLVNVLHEFNTENDTFNISDILQYIEKNNIKQAFITLDNYLINEEPYEHEIDDYLDTLLTNINVKTIESLKQKLR